MVVGDSMSQKKENGFTLIELIVSMFIVLILAGVGVPSYQQFVTNERYSVATTSLYNSFRLARTEAVKRSETITMSPVSGAVWTSGWQVVTESGEIISQVKAPHKSIVITPNAFSTIKVRGQGDVETTLANLVITTTDDCTKKRTLIILKSGQSRLEKTDVTCE